MIYKNGDVYEGYFKEGVKEGFGILISKNGDKYVGRWEDGKKQGVGKEYLVANEDFYQGEFDSDFRNGHGRLITKDLEVYDGEFKRDILIYPTTTNKLIKRDVYSKMLKSFLKPKNKKKPHLVIIA
jgi:hypothetical protein